MVEYKALIEYKETMKRVVRLYYPNITDYELEDILNYSIDKRFTDHDITISNNYNNKYVNMTLLEITEYIKSREPIVTAAGCMFKKHANNNNPLGRVIQSFLDRRSEHKKMMFKFPKGSEDFEKYNLLQQLDKIDANGLYGTLGMYTSLIYNIHIASSITSQGRALISTAILFFEMFLANNVKFGSLNEVVTYIDNVLSEGHSRKYSDRLILDKPVSMEDCFAEIILSCGYKWVPEEDDMEIIWKMLHNVSQEDLNRLYYKNNLYEFMDNQYMRNLLLRILKKLEKPYLVPMECPKEIKDEMDMLSSIIFEYVYYRYPIIDRMDRNKYMIKSVTMISDTDSAIISLDGWYRYVLQQIEGEDFTILHEKINPIKFFDVDEFGDSKEFPFKGIIFEEPELDFDFFNDEIIEMEHTINPIVILPQDNLRHSIINIMAYVLDYCVNDYLEQFSIHNHSYRGPGLCKLILKNEFLFKRVLMTPVKKSYGSIQELQEGKAIPQTMEASLDVKGMASMAKSSMADSTRDALKKILYEDILNTDSIDQLKVVKHLAILEKQIMQSIFNKSKEFYKPAVVKSMDNYEDPMGQQGIKGSVAWNAIKDDWAETLDLRERNSVSIAKIDINRNNVDKIKDKYPDLYERCIILLDNKYFKGQVTAIAIPDSEEVPDWLLEFIDYKSIVNDNISGFPLESIGCMRLANDNINYSNILKL